MLLGFYDLKVEGCVVEGRGGLGGVSYYWESRGGDGGDVGGEGGGPSREGRGGDDAVEEEGGGLSICSGCCVYGTSTI